MDKGYKKGLIDGVFGNQSSFSKTFAVIFAQNLMVYEDIYCLALTLALIKPDAISKAGEIIEIINKAGFTITKLKMMMLSSAIHIWNGRNYGIRDMLDENNETFLVMDAFVELIQFITTGPIIAMEILRDDAICEWKRLLGPANSGVARTDASGSIRALFGTDGIRNAAHGPDSFASAARVLLDHAIKASDKGLKGVVAVVIDQEE
ncbi:Nucleoside diphosphate kinase 7 [Saguinus oedipus]|uniref:Nucleoside diphosphate kinase 7 n=1 Tax=Saguinus oedipus TaxID=9490 RepID=A0ABQ9TJ40_SAGOE|nr:Nucleoside diphosphate kinase 7 [Saguinus oedipus]